MVRGLWLLWVAHRKSPPSYSGDPSPPLMTILPKLGAPVKTCITMCCQTDTMVVCIDSLCEHTITLTVLSLSLQGYSGSFPKKMQPKNKFKTDANRYLTCQASATLFNISRKSHELKEVQMRPTIQLRGPHTVWPTMYDVTLFLQFSNSESNKFYVVSNVCLFLYIIEISISCLRQNCNTNHVFVFYQFYLQKTDKKQCPYVCLLKTVRLFTRLQSKIQFLHSFIYGKHHQQCIAPNVDISLQSGRYLSHINCIIQREVSGFQVLLDSPSTQYKAVLMVSSSSSRQKLLRSWHLFHLASVQSA